LPPNILEGNAPGTEGFEELGKLFPTFPRTNGEETFRRKFSELIGECFGGVSADFGAETCFVACNPPDESPGILCIAFRPARFFKGPDFEMGEAAA